MSDETQQVCLRSPYCALCHFDLELGEIIVMGMLILRDISSFLCANRKPIVTDGNVLSPKFTRRLHHDFHAKHQALVFHPCGGRRWPRCFNDDEEGQGYHSECLEFGRRLWGTGSSIPEWSSFLAMEYSFEPPEAEKERRRQYIQRRLFDKTARTYSILPAELCNMIATLLVRECVIATSYQLWQSLGNKTFSSYLVNLSQNIYADFVTINGLHYISNLSNTPGSTTVRRTCVWKAQAAIVQVDIYFAENYLGIQKLLFVVNDNSKMWPAFGKAVQTGIWWRRLSRSSTASFRVLTDVRWNQD